MTGQLAGSPKFCKVLLGSAGSFGVLQGSTPASSRVAPQRDRSVTLFVPGAIRHKE